MPVVSVREAARAADMVLQSPKENIKMVNYNVAGIPAAISAKEVKRFLQNVSPKPKLPISLTQLSNGLVEDLVS